MSTPPELKILLALDALIDVRAETLGDEERDRVNDAIDAVHKIIEPESKLPPAAGILVRSTRFRVPCLGTVKGYDPDLRLPLILWNRPEPVLEACEPDEYKVIR